MLYTCKLSKECKCLSCKQLSFNIHSRRSFTEDLYGYIYITIRRRQNLTLKVEHSAPGQVAALANVHCSNRIGFAFFEMDDFTIMGLQFLNCEAPIPDHVYDEAIHRQSKTYYFFLSKDQDHPFYGEYL